jgi:hypothetical protein
MSWRMSRWTRGCQRSETAAALAVSEANEMLLPLIRSKTVPYFLR